MSVVDKPWRAIKFKPISPALANGGSRLSNLYLTAIMPSIIMYVRIINTVRMEEL